MTKLQRQDQEKLINFKLLSLLKLKYKKINVDQNIFKVWAQNNLMNVIQKSDIKVSVLTL